MRRDERQQQRIPSDREPDGYQLLIEAGAWLGQEICRRLRWLAGCLNDPDEDGSLLADNLVELSDFLRDATPLHKQLLGFWIDDGKPCWQPGATGIVPGVFALAQRVVVAAVVVTGTVTGIPPVPGDQFHQAILDDHRRVIAFVAPLLDGFSADETAGTVVRAAHHLLANPHDGVPVLIRDDGGWLDAFLEQSNRLPKGYFASDRSTGWQAEPTQEKLTATTPQTAKKEGGDTGTPTDNPSQNSDGPEAGCWLWWQGERHDIPKGNIYKLIAHFWDREHDSYENIDATLGDLHTTGYLKKLFSQANGVVKKIGIPWHITADATRLCATRVEGHRPDKKRPPKSPRKKKIVTVTKQSTRR